MHLDKWLDEEIEVCDKCIRACCWGGILMCDESDLAGVMREKRRNLIAYNLESTDYMVNCKDRPININA